ncbi:MAG: hypothetical protein F6K36_01855 [Symploca sp. SIO3C6]|uniref:Uncharacterized protein n=1 Tax=Symploca sp. SIO1C4 TaxID=2607765 RepID=A0A6B3N1X2_9CYAN|nr:hypothetical protein [Symploca sp. SIO3C6]NER27686.1 hypothetical protein [Symploca sp. SIO1C4]NET05151.1 hypothetical protein [Symploca sp. SIO2B6]
MIRNIIALLGVGALFAGSASIAHSQSTVPSPSEDGSVTLSGESLRTVEGRTIKDSLTFFSETSLTTQNNSEGTQAVGEQSDSSFLLNEKIELVIGDTLNSGDPLELFPNSGDRGDSERVKFQLDLGD